MTDTFTQVSPKCFHKTNQVLDSFPKDCYIAILLNGETSLADTTDVDFGTESEDSLFYLQVNQEEGVPSQFTSGQEFINEIIVGLIDGRHKLVRYGQQTSL